MQEVSTSLSDNIGVCSYLLNCFGCVFLPHRFNHSDRDGRDIDPRSEQTYHNQTTGPWISCCVFQQVRCPLLELPCMSLAPPIGSHRCASEPKSDLLSRRCRRIDHFWRRYVCKAPTLLDVSHISQIDRFIVYFQPQGCASFVIIFLAFFLVRPILKRQTLVPTTIMTNPECISEPFLTVFGNRSRGLWRPRRSMGGFSIFFQVLPVSPTYLTSMLFLHRCIG